MPPKKQRPITSFNILPEEIVSPEEQSSPTTREAEPQRARDTIDHDFGETSSVQVPTFNSLKRKKPPRELTLPAIVQASEKTGVSIRNGSPWSSFKRIYECELASEVVVVARKSKPQQLYFLKKLSGNELDRILYGLIFTHHSNIAFANDCFATTDGIFTISSFVPLTLGHIVSSQHYPDEIQISTIMTQILNGLLHISQQGFYHDFLDCSAILMDVDGTVKIGQLETCTVKEKGHPNQIETEHVGGIMMELLQKYHKEDGKIGIDDLDRWPSDSRPVSFLSATTATNSIETLLEHALITDIPVQKQALVGIAWFAIHSTITFWSYLES